MNSRYEVNSNMRNSRLIYTFIFGIAVGIIFTVLCNLRNRVVKSTTEVNIRRLHHTTDINSTFAMKLLKSLEEVSARTLAQEVRILCLIITCPKNHESKAIHVKNTWGKHCNHLIFASEKDDPILSAIKLNVPKGRVGLWAKTTEAFKYVHKNYKDQYDWVLKADDDTYVVIENLRKMLLPYKPFNGHYFGFHFKPYAPKGYASGGAGYVLSKEAVDRVVNYAFDNKHKDCPDINHTNAEDINIAKCLFAVNVSIGDSRDSHGRNRFFPFDIEQHAMPIIEHRWWFTNYRYWPMSMKGGINDWFSDEAVSFHYVCPKKMYLFEFLIYHVNVFSVDQLGTAVPVTNAPTKIITVSPTTTTKPITNTSISSA